MKKFLCILLFLLVTLPVMSQEEKHPILDDSFYIEAGVFIPSKNIELGADGSIPNEDINFGETFNLTDNESTFFFSAEWRWNRKWRVGFETFGINNGNRLTLEEDVPFEDITFEKGTFVRAGVEFDLYRVFVGRIISTGQKHSLGAGLGIHGLNIGAFVEGEVKTDLGDQKFERRGVSALIPLPNIGFWYNWAPTHRWALTARVDWFGITIDQYSGGLWNVSPGVKFQIIRNLGVGLDYRLFALNAKVSESNWKGAFDMNYSGPLITLHGNF